MSGGRLQITLESTVLRWARERSGMDPEELAHKLKTKPERVIEWERDGRISSAQADKLAHCTHTPLGFLYLPEPPVDRLPIPDLRTVGDRPVPRPSPDLLETIHTMQRRQIWMRDELLEDGVEPLLFVGAYTTKSSVMKVAEAMHTAFGLSREWAAREQTWTHALKVLRDRVEDAGVLVVLNGIVGNNTHRKLDPDEFRGFALIDPFAPLVFVNAADFKAAQMFTLAHELVHVFIGESGVSNFDALRPANTAVEQFCNRVAAEFLVPEERLSEFWQSAGKIDDPYQSVARRFKVSTLVAARRLLDTGLIESDDFFRFYHAYRDDEQRKQDTRTGGGDFWRNQNARVGRRFGLAIIRAVREGRLLYRDAFSLTGLRGKSFDSFINEFPEV